MQDIDWNDLRYILALAREKSYAAAAHRLRIDPTTVARRLREIESRLDVRLFERGAGGEIRSTQAGDIAIRRAERIEAEIGGLTAMLKGSDASSTGVVRVTAVPILINRLLVPAAAALMRQHPGLRLELVAEARDLSLARREADIAIRLARPRDAAGQHMIARRIGSLDYAAYAAASAAHQAADLPWLNYEDGMSHLPQSQWVTAAIQSSGRLADIAVNDAEALLQGVAAGLGLAFLPRIIADRIPGIVAVPGQSGQSLAREIWLLTHPDLRPQARISAVIGWIEKTFG